MARVLVGTLLLAALFAAASASKSAFPFKTAHDIQICDGLIGQVKLHEVRKSILLDSDRRASCMHLSLLDDQIPFLVRTRSGDFAHMVSMVDTVAFVDLEHRYAVAVVHQSRLTLATAAMENLDARVLRSKAPIVSANAAPAITAPKKTAAQLAEKDDIIASVSDSEYQYILNSISGSDPLDVEGITYNIETRYTGTRHNEVVGEYLFNYLKDLGFEASYQAFLYNGSPARNIIGVKRGASDDIVVVGAHMDSTSNQPTTDAPGAIDNGSGTVGVLLAAQAFANVSAHNTVHFVLFGVEEQGLIGSEYYVSQLESNGHNVVNALVMDMIGYSSSYVGVMIEGVSDPATRSLMNVMSSNVESHAPELSWTSRFYSFGSDHVPFQEAGIPCFLAIEQDETDYPGYHKTSDTTAYLHKEQAVGITRAILGTLYDVAV